MKANPSSLRYEPPAIDLENKNISHTLAIDLTGYKKNVLEIGTSTGYVSKILQEHGNTVTGIEYDREAGSIAQKFCKQVIIGDIELLDLDAVFEPLSFDVILIGDLLEHLKNPAALLNRIRRFLKPDGYLVVSLPNFFHGDVLLSLLYGDFHYTSVGLLDETHLRFFGLKNIYRLFAECGFEISEIRRTTTGIGTTELRNDLAKIPEEIQNFVKKLPDSTVYQYVFTAYPRDTVVTSPEEETDLNKIFSGVLEGHYIPIRQYQEAVDQSHGMVGKYRVTVDTLEETLRVKSQALEEKDRQLQMRDKQILDMDRHIQHLSASLNSIYQSAFWAFFEKQQKLAERAFPTGSRRRKAFDLGISGTRILVHEGWQSLAIKIRLMFFRKDNIEANSLVLSTNIVGLEGTVPLPLEKVLSGYFEFPVDFLTEIKFLTATYVRKNSPLVLKIHEDSPDSPATRTVTVQWRDISNNDFTSFQFHPIEKSRGRNYYFEIYSPGSPSAAIYFNPTKVSRTLQLTDHKKPIGGSVSFQALCKKPVLDRYHEWITKYEPNEESKEDLAKECGTFTYRPKISIVTPVWNTDEQWLRLDSI